ncbi:MAG: hydroxyacid dehydrogenase [Deltaproteobacteria bacterium]|nr:hydroxyacid dehydrogenase [Deltaproteobacteria bacterium]MBW1995766.1 hydroxyacid dehydrogenase [Deltaproteobacteria bacterium]
MTTTKVMIDVPPIHDDGLKVFKSVPDIEIIRYYRNQSLEDAIEDVDAVMVGLSIFDETVLNKGKRLKILAKHGVGYDNIDVAAASKRKIAVTVTPYANSTSVAEFTIGSILSLSKKAFLSNLALKAGTYTGFKQVTGVDIWGKTIGVIGIGRIGSEVARMCRLAFHMRVLAYDPYVTDAYIRSVGAQRAEALKELLTNSDFVSIHCPLTSETKDLIAENEMKLMKETAFLINTARGGIVNEPALLEALNAGRIQAAALDVLVEEPPASDHPLLNHERAIITPHIAANSDEAMSRMAVMAAEEILRVLNGEKPMNPVNPEIYLKS